MKRKFAVLIIGALTLLSATQVIAHEDLTALPVGDGKVSTEAKQGYVWACSTMGGGGGAMVEGPWFNGDGTFNYLEKAIIDGNVMWDSEFEITVEGEQRVFSGNSVPDHGTGVYPVSQNDDAYQCDRNPGTITEQTMALTVPANPTIADTPSCVNGGPIGVMLTGSFFFNGLDAMNRDAVAHELQDACQGHPERTGQYHYHNLTSCVEDERTEDGHSGLVGYALDGFGIYGFYGENGEIMSNDTLDECHGHTHEIEWDGETVEMYHYHATYEYPYTIGCFRGTPSLAPRSQGGMGGQPPMGGQGGGQRPPMGGTGQPPMGGGQRPPMGGGGQPPMGGGQGGQPPMGGGQGGQP